MHLHQVKPIRAAAFAANVGHYRTVFIDGNADYAIPAGAVSSEERLHKLSAFIFWTSWAASTTRPGDIASYTNNWPHEPKFQRLGVNVLFLALLLVVLGSLSGEWLSVHNKMSDTVSFYLGIRVTSMWI